MCHVCLSGDCDDLVPLHALLLFMDDVLVGPTRFALMASHFHFFCLEDRQGLEPIEESVSPVSPFHRLVRTCGFSGVGLFVGVVCLVFFFCFFMLLTNLCDRVVYP